MSEFFVQAASLEGQETNVVTDYILKVPIQIPSNQSSILQAKYIHN